MDDATQELERWLKAGGRSAGQLLILPAGASWEMRHRDDSAREDLDTLRGWQAARSIANFDDAGAYRPLKTAPNLRHGWRLLLPDAAAVRLALDFFYPAMLGVWRAYRRGELEASNLRELLGRQTGMYRITQKLTDAQAQRLIGRHCRSDGGCLKTVLWGISAGIPVDSLPAEKFLPEATPPGAMPLLCHEGCSLLVAAARKLVKEETPTPR